MLLPYVIAGALTLHTPAAPSRTPVPCPIACPRAVGPEGPRHERGSPSTFFFIYAAYDTGSCVGGRGMSYPVACAAAAPRHLSSYPTCWPQVGAQPAQKGALGGAAGGTAGTAAAPRVGLLPTQPHFRRGRTHTCIPMPAPRRALSSLSHPPSTCPPPWHRCSTPLHNSSLPPATRPPRLCAQTARRAPPHTLA